MTKQIKLLMMFFITLSVTLSSCGSDDSNESGSQIVGSWSCSRHFYGGTDTYVFKKNGTYNWSYSGSADWFEDQKGTYIYTGALLTITNNAGTTWIYVVMGITDSSMVLMDEDGDKYTYYKN